MTAQTTFGRRAPAPAPAVPTPFVAAPRPSSPAPDVLRPEAEALRAEIRAGRAASADAFSDWRRRQQGRRLVAWGLSLAFMAPGALCYVFETPLPVSAGLEIMGLIAGWWLRRERKRYLKDVANWQDPTEAE